MTNKQVYLVYQPEEAKKNQGFIQLFEQAGKKYGMHCQYCQKDSFLQQKWEQKPDLVLNRTRDPLVSRCCEEWNIPVFHPAEFVEIANHKYKILQYLQKALPEEILSSFWCPRSIFLDAQKLRCVLQGYEAQKESRGGQKEFWHILEEQKGWDSLWQKGVIKSVSGHGGNEVFLAKEVDLWKDKLSGKDVLLQEWIECNRQDLRIYVLGGKIYQGILRTGKDGFRSNYSLGGRAEVYTLSPKETKWIQAFIQALPHQWQGMYGIDFLRKEDGSFVFNEIEEMVGCRMVYQCTKKDIVHDYVDWMNRQLQFTT